MGGGGTRGGFESNLKGAQNSAAGLQRPSAEVFLLHYFGFEMELKTYLLLAGPGQSAEASHRAQLPPYNGLGGGSPKNTYFPQLSESPNRRRAAKNGLHRYVWKESQEHQIN